MSLFLQLAQGTDGQFRGFAVVEYETADKAEDVQQEMDGIWVGGNHIRVSFCAPGPPGRSMLPALIAAQAMVSQLSHLLSCTDLEHLIFIMFNI